MGVSRKVGISFVVLLVAGLAWMSFHIYSNLKNAAIRDQAMDALKTRMSKVAQWGEGEGLVGVALEKPPPTETLLRALREKDPIEEQFREAIRGCGMTRYRLSKVTGVSDSILSNFVNYKRSLTLTTAARLASALGLRLMVGKQERKAR
jgi:hypothetical protein